jgi:carbonic anhydrase
MKPKIGHFNLWVTVLLIIAANIIQVRVYAEEKGTAVILVRCADPRINGACNNLVRPEERPAVISNTGSVRYFIFGGRLADLSSQISLLVHKFGVKKVILTNHTHCGFYKELALGEQVELDDLKEVKKKLQTAFPELEIRSYLIDTETSTSTPIEPP